MVLEARWMGDCTQGWIRIQTRVVLFLLPCTSPVLFPFARSSMRTGYRGDPIVTTTCTPSSSLLFV